LIARNYKYFIAGAVSCLTFYLATAAKIMIMLPFVYVAFYVVFANGRLERVYPVLVASLALLLVGLLALAPPPGTVTFLISSMLIHRTVGNGGQVTMAYHEFFSQHPQTDYSHINLVRMVTDAYPYGNLQVGQVVGQHFWSPDMNANANFWATDGLAALGLPGVAIVSIACAILFVAINSVTQSYNRLFVALCFLPFIVSVLNASLFSSLWSGGGIFLLMFFMLNRQSGTIAAGRARGPELAVTLPPPQRP
jgi:hypothetical protein